MLPLLVTSLLAANPVEARFVLVLADSPVATLTVRANGKRYEYEATNLLSEETHAFRREFEFDAERPPEVLSLLTPPPLGCSEVLEERTLTVETLCVTTSGARTLGELNHHPFTAYYQAGQLERLELSGARWVRAAGPLPRTQPSNPFADGFAVAVTEGAVRLSPPVSGARVVKVHASGVANDVGRERCLLLARRVAAATPRATVVLGLLVEGARATPHAWVRTPARDLDPSFLADEPGAATRVYLELPTALAGPTYLELLDATRRVEGRPPTARD